MGGRIALHVALAAPQRVERLVLAATEPPASTATAQRRRRRAESDERLAPSSRMTPRSSVRRVVQPSPVRGHAARAARAWRATSCATTPRAARRGAARASGPERCRRCGSPGRAGFGRRGAGGQRDPSFVALGAARGRAARAACSWWSLARATCLPREAGAIARRRITLDSP
jgi:pimeloyl-ACP methyl ester carboxylesterase